MTQCEDSAGPVVQIDEDRFAVAARLVLSRANLASPPIQPMVSHRQQKFMAVEQRQASAALDSFEHWRSSLDQDGQTGRAVEDRFPFALRHTFRNVIGASGVRGESQHEAMLIRFPVVVRSEDPYSLWN